METQEQQQQLLTEIHGIHQDVLFSSLHIMKLFTNWMEYFTKKSGEDLNEKILENVHSIQYDQETSNWAITWKDNEPFEADGGEFKELLVFYLISVAELCSYSKHNLSNFGCKETAFNFEIDPYFVRTVGMAKRVFENINHYWQAEFDLGNWDEFASAGNRLNMLVDIIKDKFIEYKGVLSNEQMDELFPFAKGMIDDDIDLAVFSVDDTRNGYLTFQQVAKSSVSEVELQYSGEHYQVRYSENERMTIRQVVSASFTPISDFKEVTIHEVDGDDNIVEMYLAKVVEID